MVEAQGKLNWGWAKGSGKTFHYYMPEGGGLVSVCGVRTPPTTDLTRTCSEDAACKGCQRTEGVDMGPRVGGGARSRPRASVAALVVVSMVLGWVLGARPCARADSTSDVVQALNSIATKLDAINTTLGDVQRAIEKGGS